MHIIGITGTLGAGKGEVVEYLKKRGFIHFSAREIILEEVKKRGLEANRDNTTLVSNDLRTMHAPSYIIECLYEKARETGKDCIIESIRALGELAFLRKQNNFILFAVDADPQTRYERIVLRKSALDNVSYEKFLSDEKREISSSDPTKGSINDCIRLADYVFHNNGTKEELYAQVEKVLPEILEK